MIGFNMQLQMFQIDAFAKRPFQGNPAAVIPLDQWLSDTLMQQIAAENNLSETAFFVRHKDGFHIRWFTPVDEVALCGHATLAAAYVIFTELGYSEDAIKFYSLSGVLHVERTLQGLRLDFPAQPPQLCIAPAPLLAGLSITPVSCYAAEDYIVVFESEDELRRLEVNTEQLKKLDLRGVIATAPAEQFDFVARFFVPKLGITEDPVTGSAYTQLTPYWSERLGKSDFVAYQHSSRGGLLQCQLQGDRVLIAGTAVKFMQGTINL